MDQSEQTFFGYNINNMYRNTHANKISFSLALESQVNRLTCLTRRRITDDYHSSIFCAVVYVLPVEPLT